MKILLVGQPNCGKSTIFNHVVGFKAYTANFPGASVNYTRGHITIQDQPVEIVDLPGTYSLSQGDKAEEVTKKYILDTPDAIIVNTLDASVMGRSLELTLELLEMGYPLILNLNMIDEAEKKGMSIDTEKLSDILGIPVITSIGTKGDGIKDLFEKAFQMGLGHTTPPPVYYQSDIEDTIEKIQLVLQNSTHVSHLSKRLLAIRIIEGSTLGTYDISVFPQDVQNQIHSIVNGLEQRHGITGIELLNQGRHAIAISIFEQVVTFHKISTDFREKIDAILLHNVWGYVILFSTLWFMFFLIFKTGNFIEGILLDNYEGFRQWVIHYVPASSLFHSFLDGIIQGIGGGVAIVLPYLIPFLLLLSILEDVGYLPRVAYLMDILMHKIGLHGTSIIPVILGYGCSVPAVMSTRILDSPRDRFIASTISAMVPCSARMTVIFGLAAFYLGPTIAFFIYLINLLIIGILGHIMSRIMPEVSPGMVMEIPPYHLPSWKTIKAKTWLRMKEFIVVAWPVLIAGSLLLNLIQYWGFDQLFNQLLSPITASLGLPAVVGNTLIFGVLRKELSLIMLLQALGTSDPTTVLSTTQIMTFTMFITFYIPCVATLGVMVKEIGGRKTGIIVVVTLFLALIIGWMTRFVFPILVSI